MERSDPGVPATDRTLDLLARAREGDSDALDQLFARTSPSFAAGPPAGSPLGP